MRIVRILLVVLAFVTALALMGAGRVSAATTLRAPEEAGLGEAFTASLVSERPIYSARFTWLGKSVEVPVEKNGDGYAATLLLGTDVLYVEPGVQSLAVEGVIGGVSTRLVRKVAIRKVDYPEQRLSLPEKMVTPPKEVLERISSERVVIKEALKTVSAEKLWSLPLEKPAQGRVSSLYGLRRILNGKPKSPHRGLDIAAGQGAPVVAVADGRVILTGNHYYAGNSIYLDHGLGVVSHYFHLSRILVKPGQVVARGEMIGEVGSTGRVTGPHLHFGFSVLRQSVNPAPLFVSRPHS